MCHPLCVSLSLCMYLHVQLVYTFVDTRSSARVMSKVSVTSDSDFVHDVSYNYYGDKMALCTSSQCISIWNKENDWKEVHRINHAHAGPIWRLDWAHAEFGEVIASCSEDRTVSIWSSSRGVWKRRATLTDSPHAVTDVQFSPRQFGLKFAACTSDGMVRVYEAPDPLNLSVWEVEDLPCVKGGCSALSWGDVERLGIVGSAGKLFLYEKTNRWNLVAEIQASDQPLKDCAWAPNLCRESDWIATCGECSVVSVWAVRDGTVTEVHKIDCGVSPIWRCAWSLTGDILSVAPENGQVQVWRLAGIHGTWERVLENDDK